MFWLKKFSDGPDCGVYRASRYASLNGKIYIFQSSIVDCTLKFAVLDAQKFLSTNFDLRLQPQLRTWRIRRVLIYVGRIYLIGFSYSTYPETREEVLTLDPETNELTQLEVEGRWPQSS